MAHNCGPLLALLTPILAGLRECYDPASDKSDKSESSGKGSVISGCSDRSISRFSTAMTSPKNQRRASTAR
jgi:hypothetical protein